MSLYLTWYYNVCKHRELYREQNMAMVQTRKLQIEANGTRYVPMPPHDANNMLRSV